MPLSKEELTRELTGKRDYAFRHAIVTNVDLLEGIEPEKALALFTLAFCCGYGDGYEAGGLRAVQKVEERMFAKPKSGGRKAASGTA